MEAQYLMAWLTLGFEFLKAFLVAVAAIMGIILLVIFVSNIVEDWHELGSDKEDQ